MTSYRADFCQWAIETAELLRRGEFAGIDMAALIDEVEDLSRRERAALESRLIVLVAHLLKWDVQCGRRSRSWQLTIRAQRRRVERLLRDSPSLRAALPGLVPDVYVEALDRAVRETGLAPTHFPSECPYRAEEILCDKPIEL